MNEYLSNNNDSPRPCVAIHTVRRVGDAEHCNHDDFLTDLFSICFTRVADLTSRRRLRSSASHRPDVPPILLSTVGKRAFPVSGATAWNDLPLHVASAPSLAVFRQRLNTFLFSRSYQDTII